MRNARLAALLAAVLILAMALAGCAPTEETTASAEPSTAATEASESAEASVSAEAEETESVSAEPVPQSTVTQPEDPGAEEIAVDVAQTGSNALIDAVKAGAPVRIGLSVPSLADPFFAQVRDGVQAACDERGYELVPADATDSAEKQATDLATFALQGFTAVIACPVDQKALEESAAMLNQAGTILVSFGPQSQDLDAPRFSGKQVPGANAVFVMREYDYGSTLGGNAAAWIRDRLGDMGNVLILTDDTELQSYTRANGMMDAIMSSSMDSFIVDRAAATDRESGRQATAAALAAMPDINVILATTDAAALGAQDAVREAGLAPEKLETFYIGGCGGSTDVRTEIESGQSLVRATVTLTPQQVGASCVKAVADILESGTMPVQDAVVIAYWTPMLVMAEAAAEPPAEAAPEAPQEAAPEAPQEAAPAA